MDSCIVGLGTVGSAVAKYLHSRGEKIVGYDVDRKAVEKFSAFPATTEWGSIPDVEKYVICVSTSNNGNKPQLDALWDVCRKIQRRGSSRVFIESTVPVGTCRKLSESIFHSRTEVVYCPHRFWVKDQVNHGVKQLRLLGSVTHDGMKAGQRYYKRVGIPVKAIMPVEVVEMAKIVENAFRYVNIAFAEQIFIMCADSNLDFEKVRDAANTKWNVDIPEARRGIGGTCLPKDVIYALSLSRHNELLRGSVAANRYFTRLISQAGKGKR